MKQVSMSNRNRKKEFIKNIKVREKVVKQRIMEFPELLFYHLELACENAGNDWDKGDKIRRTEIAQQRSYVEAILEDPSGLMPSCEFDDEKAKEQVEEYKKCLQ